MGGYGSGRRWSRKMTVEECLTLNAGEFTTGDRLCPTSWASMRWLRGGAERACVDYSLRDIGFKGREPIYVLTLHSPLIWQGQRIRIDQNIYLVTSQLYRGGRRFWFDCGDCRRRVGRLHLPYGMSYFLCRRCYDLTYMSCQESHKCDWFFDRMCVPPSVGKRLFRRN